MRNRIRSHAVVLLVAALVLTACTSKQKTEGRKSDPPPEKQEASVTFADPTPPDPPSSVEVPVDLKNMPAFLMLAIGGIAGEGEKEGVEVQDNFRLFRTDASSREILAFYAKEMKDRGWTLTIRSPSLALSDWLCRSIAGRVPKRSI
jgi:hypothetical protein